MKLDQEKNKSEWIWMPHAAHFVAANSCAYKLATYVNGYIISTVGEYEVKEMLIIENGKAILPTPVKVKEKYTLENYVEDEYRTHLEDFTPIGMYTYYETAVFKAERNPDPKFDCCPYRIIVDEEMVRGHSNDPLSAYKIHMKWCEECDKKNPKFSNNV